ncbi:hypothetical protein CEXT_497271 [Caerostris extrusa]|uniref:Uncharacterized protein n=1 Tax=Caerostris extrusa TaxID=172846 RepID=A0AAV4N9G0_CAEEX|nr:hypothetical protein CEXT_497271 [Caerostris extrusa]
MECVNLLGQGRPVSQIQLATAGWLSPSYQIWNASTFLARVRPDSQIQLPTARVTVSFLSNMECVNLLGQGRPVSQITTGYSPGGCLLPIKYGMRQPSWPG